MLKDSAKQGVGNTHIHYSNRILKTPDREGYTYMYIIIPKVIKRS